jgi:uncharacterized RDD family membrane protein YckC
VGGVVFDAFTENHVVSRVRESLDRGIGGRILTPNVDIVRQVRQSAFAADVVAASSIVVADGMPLVWAARLAGRPLIERITGADLIFALSEVAAANSWPVYLIGGLPGADGQPGAAELAARGIAERYPGIGVAGAWSPPARFDAVADDVEEMRAALAAGGLGWFLALFVGGLFGKSVALAWFGRRALPSREPGHEYPPVIAVLLGGTVALLLYVVPVLGFIAYKALDVLGLGIVVYTLLLAFRARRAASTAPQVTPPHSGLAEAVAAAPDAPADSAGAPAAEAPPARVAPPPVSLELANRAGFWIRMLALFLDLVLVAIVCGIVSLPIHHSLLLILAAYGAVMWKLKSTTIGGIVCGLRVARLDGRPIDWPTAVTRALGSFLSFFIVGLGFIWVVFDAERQSWHDKIAGTVVVHAPRGTPLV